VVAKATNKERRFILILAPFGLSGLFGFSNGLTQKLSQLVKNADPSPISGLSGLFRLSGLFGFFGLSTCKVE
jgi:hypothetical protein